jgi:outer membrane biosynthesis protein TonB
MSAERMRLTYALLLSLLLHAMLLSLIFGGNGLWLPGFGFPWQVRRIEAPDLRVVVVPAQVEAEQPTVAPVAEPLQPTWVEPPVARGPAPTPSVSLVQTPRRTAEANLPDANPSPGAKIETDVATAAAPAQLPRTADLSAGTAIPPIPAPDIIALDRTDEATWAVPVPPATPAPVIATAPSDPSPETVMPPLRDAGDNAQAQADQDAGNRAVEPSPADGSKQEELQRAQLQEAARIEAARAENARREAERQDAERHAAKLLEAARQDAAQMEASRVEAARVEAARVEAARVEAARVEAARVEAARVEAARVEAARVEAARVEAARVEAVRVEAARVEAARVEAARVEAARVEAATAEAARVRSAADDDAQKAAARREATLRAIGRQLDEEAARRDAATAAARLPPSSSSARRYRLFGRSDPNAELILYAEAWARKIQMNLTFEMVREAAKQPHTDPLVTVAIRSDGSVESVTFVHSSGVAALDEAIRRVVHSQTPYQVFPPGLAREFDVIEIRRTWYFDIAIRLY